MKQLSTFFAMLLVSMLLIGSSTFAQITWTAGNSTSDWSTASNWSSGTVPTAGDDVTIPNTAIQPVLTTAAFCNGLTIETGAILDMDGSGLTASAAVTISGTLKNTGASANFTVNDRINIMSGGTLDSRNIGTITLDGDWTKAGTFILGTSTLVDFVGTTAHTINSTTTFFSLRCSTTDVLYLGGSNVNVTGVLTIAAGTLDAGSATITIQGNAAVPFVNGATFTANTSTFVYAGSAAQAVTSATYNNLTINHADKVFTAAGNVTVEGNLNIIAGEFSDGNNTITLGGNFTNSDTFTLGGVASTFVCDGTAAQSLPAVGFNDLTISNVKAVVSLSSTGTTTVSNDLTIDAGASLFDSGQQIDPIGNNLVVNGTLTLGNANATEFPTLSGAFSGTGTVNYAATANQTVSAQTYTTNVVLTGGGTKTAEGNFSLAQDFTIGSGVTFDDDANSISIDGRWYDNGTYAASGTVLFTGTTGTTIASETYYDLVVGTVNPISADGDITVMDEFSIPGGAVFDDDGNTIFVQGTVSEGGTYSAGTGTVDFNGSGPMTITGACTFNNLTLSGGGTLSPDNALTIGGDLVISNGDFVGDAFTYTISGGFSNSGTVDFTTSTVTFDGTGAITLNSATSFNDLNVDGSGEVTLAGTFMATVDNSINIDGTLITGTNYVQGAGDFNLNAGGTLDFANTAGITGANQTSGTTTLNAGANYVLDGTGQISGEDFPAQVNDITFAGTGTTTLTNAGGLVVVDGDLYLVSGEVGNADNIQPSNAAHTVYVEAGTVDMEPDYSVAGAGNINLDYTGAAAGFTTGDEVPTDPTLVGDLTSGTKLLNIGQQILVNGTLTLGGIVSTSAGTLVIGNATDGGAIAGSGYVDGKLGWQYKALDGAKNNLFQIGANGLNRNIALNLASTPAVTVFAKVVNQSATDLGYTAASGVSKVSNVRYFQVTADPSPSALSAAGQIQIYYGPDDGVQDIGNLTIVTDQGTGTTWTDLTSAAGGTAVTTGNILSAAASIAVTKLAAKYALGNNDFGSNYLPVELTSFYGTSREENIALSWTTATEINSSKFIVERKAANLENWAEVGEVQAAGNSNAPKTYSFVDKSASGATSFDYRLSYVDVNGNTKVFGKTISVDAAVPESFTLSQNYPNPFNPSTVIKYALPQAAHVSIRIYNMLGQEVATIVNQQADKGFYKVTWDGRTSTGNYAASGVYIYRIIAGNFVQTKKMNLLK